LAEHARVIVEKPFGLDLASARELNQVAHSVFPENSVFRIVHFLGKEAIIAADGGWRNPSNAVLSG
jgi:glucose-6-phosphate 1-dehydrogenase